MKTPMIVYTSERDRNNIAQHGRSLAVARLFQWNSALTRRGIHEQRATGTLSDGSLVVVSYRDNPHDTAGPVRRITLLRDATPEERNRYLERQGAKP